MSHKICTISEAPEIKKKKGVIGLDVEGLVTEEILPSVRDLKAVCEIRGPSV